MHPLRTLLALVAVSAAAAASTVALPFTVFDGSGGPLLAGNVYTCNAINVPAGQTLTVQAGAIIKFSSSRLIVDGTLNVQGTAAEPVYFTSLRDDSVGGDTNADGNGSTPTPGSWDGIELRSGSANNVLDHAVVRYHGAGGWSGVYFSTSNTSASITNCTITDGATAGINLNNQLVFPVITGCTFTNNSGAPAIAQARLESVPFISNNTASGNPGGDFIHVTTFQMVNDVAISAANCMGGALVVNTTSLVNAGLTLTLGPDVVIKMVNSRLIVDGSLKALGTAGHPVTFTAYKDDSIAGDTNKDGNASSPLPGQWDGIELRSGSHDNVLDHAVVRYHGAGGWSGVYFSTSNTTATISDCTITDGATAGINLNNQLVFPVITGCSFTNNSGAPTIANARLESVPFISDNTASGNPGGDFIHVTTFQMVSDVAISAANCMGGALVVNTTSLVNAGLTLTLGPDVVLKMISSRLIVDGSLKALGTAGHPVTITAYKDDSVAGDTNKDGNATSPTPGQWDGIELRSGSHDNVLDHAVVRYHGAGGWSGVYVSSANTSATITDCTISDGATAAINLNNQYVFPVIKNCTFTNNSGAPTIANARLESVPFISDNTATGNPGGNFIHVTTFQTANDVSISADNCLGGALVVNTTSLINSGNKVTLGAGVVLKMVGSRLIVDGTLDVAGTPHAPVVITSYKDDDTVGDTNLDGSNTVAAKGIWDGIELRSGSTSDLQNLLVRFAGAGGWAGVRADSGVTSASLHNVRVQHTATQGFYLQDTVQADDLVAWDCDNGIDMPAGSFDLLRSTAAGCIGFGIHAQAPQHTGEVRGCVAWGNGADYLGLAAGQASFCDGTGLVGGTGNSSGDPLFVDAANGNLRPSPGSPVIDAGDPAVLPSGGQDLSTFPRFTDGNLDKVRRVDMGAYEYDNLELAVSATRSPGEALDILTTDHADMADLWMFIGLSMNEYDAHRFGTLFVDLIGPNQILFWPKVPETIAITVPLDIPVGTQFVWQIGGRLHAVAGSPGNLSNPVCSTID